LQEQYASLLARLEAAEAETGFFRVNARVIERASPPAKPANPSRLTVLAAASVAGLLVGLALVFVREQLDDSFRTSDHVASRLGFPYFGPIPRLGRSDLKSAGGSALIAPVRLRRSDRNKLAKMIYAAEAPYSFFAETLRRILIDVRPGITGTRPFVIAIASALSNEGKSMLASNLAFFLAGQGYQVLLVDADLRNPDLSRRLLPLAYEADLSRGIVLVEPGSALFRTSVAKGVTLIGIDDPGRLPEAERELSDFGRTLGRIGGDAGVVVVDLPPLAFVADGLGHSDVVDAIVLAVRWGKTRGGALRRVLAANPAIADKIRGVALTRVRPAALRREEFIRMDSRYYAPRDRAGPVATVSASGPDGPH
jgi:succinoglycan biosynthesis transport protein ExoP